ncbi:rubredoxin [Nitrococcus mobilis]
MCVICGWIYEEEKGLPEAGIEPGTHWDDIPEDFVCPECGATKEDFEMIEV